MGNCRSCEATAATAGPSPTATLVLTDGELSEFDSPIRASQVLTKEHDSFICNADDMDFDGPVSGLSAGEELQLGQLYFLLPRSKLRRRLSAEEMAALAVRANNALVKCQCRRGWSAVAPLVFEERPETVRAEAERRRHRRAGSSGRGRDFTSALGPIPESAE